MNMAKTVMAMLVGLCLEVSWGLPYGGWGPREGFGHTGNTFPAPNPNAIYGYDYFDILDDWTSYGAKYNPHKNRTHLLTDRAKKNSHVSSQPVLVPSNSLPRVQQLPRRSKYIPLSRPLALDAPALAPSYNSLGLDHSLAMQKIAVEHDNAREKVKTLPANGEPWNGFNKAFDTIFTSFGSRIV